MSADEHLIEAARRRAAEERTTLNAQFRLWLADYAGRGRRSDSLMETIEYFRKNYGDRVRKFTRDEMNERSYREIAEEDAPSFASRWRGRFQPVERDDPIYDALARKYLQ